MRTALFAAILFLLACNVLADPQPWMKQDNPNELPLAFGITDTCRASEETYKDIVRGVLIRSRIKQGDSDVTRLHLIVDVSCGQLVGTSDSEFAFRLGIYFGIRTEDGDFTVHYPGYGVYGIESELGLQDALKDSSEDAITDYLQANFDL